MSVNTIRYPLLWIINQRDPSDAKAIRNKACKKIPRLLKFRDWLLERYGPEYRYSLTEHLHEYGLDEPIKDFLGLRVTSTRILDIKFYRRSWCEVYVDTIIKVFADVYTGDEYAPQRRNIYADYRVRGYYDLYERSCHLFQCFLPYRPEDDMDKTPLDDFLIPIIGDDDLEMEAHCYLEEYYEDAFYHPGALNLNALAKENGLNIRVTGLSPDGNGKKARLYLFEKQETLYDENGKAVSVKVPANTILVERRLYETNKIRAFNSIAHECIHFGEHSLFELTQAMYRDELLEHFGITDVNTLPMDAEECKEIRIMEWQAKRLAPRIQMLDDHVDEKMWELLKKYGWREKHAMLKCIIMELADYFKVSKEAAKYRIQELGYTNTSGDMNFIDEAYIPAYDVPDSLRPFETFDLSKKELLNMFREDKQLRDLLHSGDFVYCESHLCLNDPLYIQKRNGKLYLTDYAHKHMIECCLLFSKRRILNYNFESGVFQDTIPEQYHKAFLSGTPAQKARWKKLVSETRKALPSNFADIVAYYIENWGISTRIIADRCCLSNGVISKCKTNHNYKPDIPIVAALSLGIGLVPGLNDHMMHRAGHFLDGETDQEIVYDILLSTMYADDIVAWNDFVVSEGLPPLIRDKQTGVK